jgi:ABC-type transporter Mla subunit MlaD
VSYARSLISQNAIIIDKRLEQMQQLTDNLGQLIPQIDGVQTQLANAHQDMQQLSAASAQIQDTLRGLNDRVNDFNRQIGQVRELVDAQSNCEAESLCTQLKAALNYFDSISKINVPMKQSTLKFTSIDENLYQSTESIPLVKSSLIEMNRTGMSGHFVSELPTGRRGWCSR